MALIRWQPFQEMETLRRQMDQMFDEMTALNRNSQATWQPAIELQDTEENVILRAEIPGIEGKDLDVRVTPRLGTRFPKLAPLVLLFYTRQLSRATLRL